MANEDDSLVRRRSRRSTAGNRMEAALAEIIAEEAPREAEEDNDFVLAKDEADVFESDFESTDEEVTQEASEAGEKALQEEDKRERKAARARVERAVAHANDRQRVTFNPQIQIPDGSSAEVKTPKPKRRVSLGVAIDAETGEVVDSAQRRSKRTHTMLNRTVTANRIKDAEERRASITKKTKVKIRPPTQDELIARALDMEEGNTSQHKDYLSREEEKRKRARVVRVSIQGPLLRWISKGEEIKTRAPQPAPPPPPQHNYWYSTPPAANPPTAIAPYAQYAKSKETSWPTWPPPPPTQSQPQTPPGPSNLAHQPILYQYSGTPLGPNQHQHPYSHSYYVPISPPSLPPPTPHPIEKTERVTKNYVVQEIEQNDKAPRPSWRDTMVAMFGDHVDWEEVKVFVGKGRPLSRPVMKCPITGLAAPYLDPRTGVPFADIHSYQVLTCILNHEYVWEPTLGCYVGKASDQDELQKQDL